MSIDKNQETSKTPSQDGQGRWYELLSPTQVLTGQETPILKTEYIGNIYTFHQ